MKAVAVMVLLLAAVPAVNADTLYVGRLDTIGGTTHDWQLGGPALRRCCYSQGSGIYVLWMSSQLGDPYPDRNMKYNFWDEASREWAFIEPDFMGSGAGVFPFRAGFGNLDIAPGSGEAWASAHAGNPLRPVVANLTVGDLNEGPEGYQWPVIACGQEDRIHLAMMDNASQDGLWYSRAPFDSVVELGRPGYVSYNLAASKVAGHVAAFWLDAESGERPVYYRISPDAGTSWGQAIELEPPPAYGQDTVPAFSLWGPFPFYDGRNRLHLVTSVMPVARETTWVLPAEIWHWCPENAPPWSRVHRAEAQNLVAPVGYNAIYADRPSIGEDALGRLYVMWEQFDSANVEPQTNLLRAGIWLAGSTDNGQTWNPALRLTPENAVSHRFPCVVDRPFTDSVGVTYMMDVQAGFFVQGQGVLTRNPIAFQWVPAQAAGLAEQMKPGAPAVGPGPTIVRGGLNMGRQRTADDSRQDEILLDAAGRRVPDLVPGVSGPGALAPGVYFVCPVRGPGRGGAGVRKVVVLE